MNRIVIYEITKWCEDERLIAGDISKEGEKAVMDQVQKEHEDKDVGWTLGLEFVSRTAETLEEALDEYNEQYCKYDYLKACDAEYDVYEEVNGKMQKAFSTRDNSDYVYEAVEDLDAGASYDDIGQELDKAKYEDFCTQLNFLVNNEDPKTQALYKTFKDGWKDEYDDVTVANEYISIRDLHPTQNVIFANKSLVPMLNGTWTVGGDKDGKGGKPAVEVTMSGGGVQIPLGSPLVVCNVGGINYLIDGHHRWSKFYAFNPTCKLQSWVIRNGSGKGIFRSADDVLKFAQGTLAALGQDTVVQQSKTDVNMYDLASGGEDAGFNWMLNTVNKNITPQVLQAVINSNLGKRNGIKDNTTLAHYLWQNLDTVMFEAAPAGVHGREYMPQYPSGVNPEQAVDMIQESTKVTLTYGQLKRLVKESSGDRFQELLDKPTTFDGKTDKHPIIGKVYYSKENKFAWKLVWNKARNEDRIHVFKPSIISVAGDKRFGWREYLISADLETMKEIGFKDFDSKEEAQKEFNNLVKEAMEPTEEGRPMRQAPSVGKHFWDDETETGEIEVYLGKIADSSYYPNNSARRSAVDITVRLDKQGYFANGHQPRWTVRGRSGRPQGTGVSAAAGSVPENPRLHCPSLGEISLEEPRPHSGRGTRAHQVVH